MASTARTGVLLLASLLATVAGCGPRAAEVRKTSGAPPLASDRGPRDPRVAELVTAASLGQVERVRELLEAGVPAGATDAEGWTSLGRAVVSGHEPVVRLLAQQLVVAELLPTGATPLAHAVAHGFAGMVGPLVDLGGDTDERLASGETLLTSAVTRGDETLVGALLEAGADANLEGAFSRSPLEIAIRSDRIDLARLLMDRYADPGGIVAGDGTVLKLARELGRTEAAALLLARGAPPDGSPSCVARAGRQARPASP